MKGRFITGTDTDAGKTTVTAALLRALKVAGVPAAAVKPVQTGCVMRGGEEENRGEAASHEGAFSAGGDGDSLQTRKEDCACGCCGKGGSSTPEHLKGWGNAGMGGVGASLGVSSSFFSSSSASSALVAPDVACYEAAGGGGIVLETYEPACSPHLAARLAGRPLTVSGLREKLERKAPDGTFLLIEGAGGIYVPLNDRETMLDFMREIDFPVLLVVGNKLGCINHALLSLDVLQSHGLRVCGMILNRPIPETVCDPGSGPDPDVGNDGPGTRRPRARGNPLPNRIRKQCRKRMVLPRRPCRARRGSPEPVVLGLPFQWNMPRQRFITYRLPVFFP